MELENQVCSLELAKKLKKLGIKQKSLWWWRDFPNSPELTEDMLGIPNEIEYSAFTVAELGKMLKGTGCWSLVGETLCTCNYTDGQRIENELVANTEANARAKMLIWLIENKKTTQLKG